MCVGVSVWLVWSGIRVAGCFSLQHGYHSNPTTPKLQSVLLAASACNTDTTPTQPHRNSNTHRTTNNTTNVVIQQNSRKLLLMDIIMSEICWAHKKWNKIASDIKLVFYSSTITMLHGPRNIRFSYANCTKSFYGLNFSSNCQIHIRNYVLMFYLDINKYTA